MRPGAQNPTAPARLTKVERQAKALELRLAGVGVCQIADELRINRVTVWRYLDGALKQRKQEIVEGAETLRAIEAEMIDQYIASLRPQALAGDLGAHRALLRWHERRARLLNLDLREDDAQTAPQIIINTSIPGLGETIDGTYEEMPAIGSGESS